MNTYLTKAYAWLKKHTDAFTGGEYEGDPIYLKRTYQFPGFVKREVAEYNREVCGVYVAYDDVYDSYINHNRDIAYKSSLTYDDLHQLGISGM